MSGFAVLKERETCRRYGNDRNCRAGCSRHRGLHLEEVDHEVVLARVVVCGRVSTISTDKSGEYLHHSQQFRGRIVKVELGGIKGPDIFDPWEPFYRKLHEHGSRRHLRSCLGCGLIVRDEILTTVRWSLSNILGSRSDSPHTLDTHR